ncbi:MAG TPA: hypothetical protein VF864_09035 [Gemmatimonadales bacterium]
MHDGDDKWELEVAGTWLHDLCRVGARNLRRAGVSESEVMKLGRWKTPSMFHRYDIIDEKDLNNCVAKLAAALETAQQLHARVFKTHDIPYVASRPPR